MNNSSDSSWGGTGATPLPYDWRDRLVERHPSVSPFLSSFPESASLRQYQTGPALNQGEESSCVAFSSCHLQAFYEQMERKQWVVFDGHALYVENGGTGNNGVLTRDVLQYLQARGCPVLGASTRYKIQSYAFVDFSNDFLLAIQTVKAAIAANRPVVLAMLLPSDFTSGTSVGQTGSQVTSGYHQVLVGGYTLKGLDIFNSWGPGFGDNGWANVSIDYLARPEQQGWLYAFTSFDGPDDNLPLPSPSPVKIEFNATAGKLKGNGALQIWPDSAITIAAGTKVHVKQM